MNKTPSHMRENKINWLYTSTESLGNKQEEFKLLIFNIIKLVGITKIEWELSCTWNVKIYSSSLWRI